MKDNKYHEAENNINDEGSVADCVSIILQSVYRLIIWNSVTEVILLTLQTHLK